MNRTDRIALVAICWFAVWIGIGAWVGRMAGFTGSGIITGFFVALLSTFGWPWVLPNFVWRWMDE